MRRPFRVVAHFMRPSRGRHYCRTYVNIENRELASHLRETRTPLSSRAQKLCLSWLVLSMLLLELRQIELV